jgi:hypothetical protein
VLEPGRLQEDQLGYLSDRADVHFGAGVAEGFLTGRAEPEQFLKASRDLEAAIAGVEKFGVMDLLYCLKSIRCALLGHDWERARTLTNAYWPRIRKHEEAGISKKLAERDATVLPVLDDYFERARRPEEREIPSVDWAMHPIQLAVLRAELVHPDAPVDWWQAARDVAR